MTKQSGQRAAKRSGALGANTSARQKPRPAEAAIKAGARLANKTRNVKQLGAKKRSAKRLPAPKPELAEEAQSIEPAGDDPWAAAKQPADKGASAAQAELSRMISELNEVRMRLDAIVRKLASSTLDVPDSSEAIDDVERLRMRLLGKLDRVREQLVTRLTEERVTAKDP